jgi:ABC-type Fe3+/spermidine/putrescine transport system ATPase subunit
VLPKVGDKLTCCIRPEALRVVAAGEQAGPGYNVFTAKLLEWIPLGDCARFRVRAGAVELSGSAMPARPVAQAGADVQIAISPRDIAVLKE